MSELPAPLSPKARVRSRTAGFFLLPPLLLAYFAFWFPDLAASKRGTGYEPIEDALACIQTAAARTFCGLGIRWATRLLVHACASEKPGPLGHILLHLATWAVLVPAHGLVAGVLAGLLVSPAISPLAWHLGPTPLKALVDLFAFLGGFAGVLHATAFTAAATSPKPLPAGRSMRALPHSSPSSPLTPPQNEGRKRRGRRRRRGSSRARARRRAQQQAREARETSRKAPAPAPVRLAPPAGVDWSTTRCPYYAAPIAPEAAVACPSCETVHHGDCWSESETCTTYACQGWRPASTS